MIVVELVSHYELRSVDHSLTLELNSLANLVRSHSLADVKSYATSDAMAIQVLDASGSVVAASADLQGEGPLVSPAVWNGSVGPITVANMPLGSGEPFRISRRLVHTPSGTWTVVAGESVGPVESTIHGFTLGLVVAGVAMTLLVSLLVAVLTRRAMRPIEKIRARVDTIAMSASHQRVPEPETHDEVGRLARTMNAMLARLESAEQRQRRFVADASHELKSPLSAATTELSVAAAHPDTADWPDVADAVLGDLERLRALAEDLLTLARLDESPTLIGTAAVDLDEIVTEEVTRLTRISNATIDASHLGAGRIHGDRDALRRLVRNLLDNALAHAINFVRLRVESVAGTVELEVTNDGPTIGSAHRDLIFQRFTRLDVDRSPSEGGSGLGLAIVAAVAAAHHADIEVRDAAPGTTFLIRFRALDIDVVSQ